MFLVLSTDRAPPLAELDEIGGTVKKVYRSTSGRSSTAVRFSLDDTSLNFVYLSKGGADDRVLDVLQRAGSKAVLIVYDSRDAHSPPFDSQSYHAVYSVQVGGEMVRSYDEVATSWNADSNLGRWAGVVFVLVGIGAAALLVMRDDA